MSINSMKCPECKSKDLIIDSEHGEVFCKTCGIVIEDNLISITRFDIAKKYCNCSTDQYEALGGYSKIGCLDKFDDSCHDSILINSEVNKTSRCDIPYNDFFYADDIYLNSLDEKDEDLIRKSEKSLLFNKIIGSDDDILSENCPKCKSTKLFEDNQKKNIKCSACGYLIQGKIESSPNNNSQLENSNIIESIEKTPNELEYSDSELEELEEVDLYSAYGELANLEYVIKADNDQNKFFNDLLLEDFLSEIEKEELNLVNMVNNKDLKLKSVESLDQKEIESKEKLCVFEESEIIGHLIKMLNDYDAKVRLETAISLGIIGDRRAVNYLKNAFKDPDKTVQEAAREAVRNIKKTKPII